MISQLISVLSIPE